MRKYKFTHPEIIKQLNKLTSYFQEKKCFAPDTARTYCNYAGYFLEWLQTERLTPEGTTYNDLLQFVNHCKKAGRSTSNINLILISLRHYFDMLQLRVNPATGLHLRGETRAIPHDLLSANELHRLYESYPVYNARTQRNKVITGLYVYQGITTRELKKLEPGHIHLKEGKIYLPGTSHTRHKSGLQPRSLKLRANQILELQEYLLVTRPKILYDLKTGHRQTQSTRKPDKVNWAVIEHQLFISLNGSEKIKSTVSFLMEDLRKINTRVKDGLYIRKSVIVNWLKEKDIRQVQYMAGHSKISSTEKYRAVNLEELEEALKIHHPLG
ncbi:phage integrase family protein [Fulvivirga imtechensis AK7]|uniref:Phage integrase family protein n=1 Tax=Fulvivirga imtechensis AK7 TaxID=1237149 RepID=L8JLA9_9BACT|nr:tyrosine-type recombinase/integrase [Fulvivirga imtechensis]ELR68187.1 phage integrase family protein [Fulvivirga imtechensis AK7]